MRGGLRGLFTENTDPSGKSSRRARARARAAGRGVRRVGEWGSGGVHRQFENRRRLPAVPLTPRQKFVGTAAGFSATQKERTCVFAEGRSADPSSSPVRSVSRSQSETEKRERERPTECTSDEASFTLIQLRNVQTFFRNV